MKSAVKVLVGGRLIDGTERPPNENVAIVIEDDRIASITNAAAQDWPIDAELIDVVGKTIMPGLIDCHDHLGLHGGDVASRWGLNEPRSTRIMRTANVLTRTLNAGYTTVRDAGGLDFGFKVAIAEGLLRGPRLLIAVAIISPIGGIGDPTSPSGHCCCTAHDPLLPKSVATGASEVRAVVRRMVSAGADVIKCATTGGASGRQGHGPRDRAFNSDEMAALVDEARNLGRRVMCHALGGIGLRLAIEANVNSIEHGCYLDQEPDLIRQIADRGIFLVPTFTVYDLHRRFGAPHSRKRAEDLQQHHISSLQKAVSMGVKIAAGTDGGMHGHPCNAIELQHLVNAGMSPGHALRAATGLAAECLGIQNEVGTIEKGKVADLIVVDGDPLNDVSVLQKVEAISIVMKEGALIKADLA